MSQTTPPPDRGDWPAEIYQVFKAFAVTQVAHVPDAGHAALIRRCDADPDMVCTTLTTEEEGVALAAGAWLGGSRAALLMQSSGVGNCLNMLSMTRTCRFPLLTLVTMRGEWGEFNPWQRPMSAATEAAFRLMDVAVLRVERPTEVGETVAAGAGMAFEGGMAVAILLAQRLIGAKSFTGKEG
jgi:sulfopyruvate decarboxylase alpha subunit